MIWHDNGYGCTQDSLEYFRQHRDCIGPVVGVTMLYYYQGDEWVGYPLRIVGEEGEIWLSGCNSGYGGEGPHGSGTVLEELGYSEPYCRWPLVKVEFELGPPDKPELPVEPVKTAELTEAHEEVLDVIKTYYQEHGEMPAVWEIAELAVLSTSNSVWDRLKELEMAGRIKRERHKARSIELI